MQKHRVRVAVLVAAVIFAASACGARVTEDQVRASAGGSATGLAAGSGGTGDVAGADGGGGGGDGLLVPGDAPAGDVADPAAGPAPDPAAGGQEPGAPAPGGGPAPAAAPAPPAGGNGGATDVGVTPDTIVLGNVSTLSGPVPGLFQGAVIGTQAVVAYQNSLGGMFGRKFKLDVRDDQFDTGQNRSQTVDLLGKAFAFVGSFSLYDDSAPQQIAQSGIPDVTYSLSQGRREVPNNFSVSPQPRGWRTGPFEYYAKKYPEAVKAVATIHGDVPAAAQSHADARAVAESLGYKFVYDRAYAATETDFTADVIRMRQAGAKMFFVNSMDVKNVARIAKAMQQQGFKPELFAVGGAAYDPALVSLGGAAVEGIVNDQPYALFAGEDAGSIPEVKLFNEWLNKVKPGYKPDLFAAFAWASGRLFFQALEQAGPKATRADVIAQLKKIDDFSSNGLLPPAGPASKRPPTCYLLAQVKGGKFQRLETPAPGFRCEGSYKTR